MKSCSKLQGLSEILPGSRPGEGSGTQGVMDSVRTFELMRWKNFLER